MIELTINGKKITAQDKDTILQTALKNNIYIPNLCFDKRLKPYGSCRLCVVEVEKAPRLFAACSSPATNGMVIRTDTPKLRKARQTVLELLLVHHSLDCPICDKTGECDLQDMVFKYGSSRSRFFAIRKHDPERIDAPIVERNSNRCILCGKCTRICHEHQGVGAIDLIGRGFDTKVSPAFEEALDCEFCGQCIDVCPVGALGAKSYRFRSRAWYLDEYKTICPYCGCGCTTNIGIREGKIIRAKGREGVGINEGNLCSKGRFGLDYIYSENRLTTPMIKKDGTQVPVSWEEALQYVAERLESIKKQYGQSAIGAIGSQRCTIEDNYMLQKFMRDVIGSDNVDSAARFGYARFQIAIKKAFGVEFLPIKWNAPLDADFILIVESDITSTLPVWGLKFIEAKNKGATLIVADSKETKLTRHSAQWLRVKPGFGITLLNSIMKVIIDEGLYDKNDISAIQNFNALVDSLKVYSPSVVSGVIGISEKEIVSLARSYAASKKRLLALTSNTSENTKSLNTILAAANLVILMGDSPDTLQVPAEFSNTFGMWTAGIRPLSDGKNAYEMLYESSVKALYIMGENPLITFQGASKVESTLKDLELLIVQDIFLTDTAKLADVILPACSWAEKEGQFMTATGIIQKMPALVAKTGQSTADWKIFRDLAKVMNKDLGLKDLNEIRAEITSLHHPSTLISHPSFNPVSREAMESASDEYPLFFVTVNILQHSGALSVFSKNLNSVVSDACLQMNTKDAKKYNIPHDSFVKVISKRGEIHLKAALSDEIPEGTVFAPVHFAHAKVNTLTYPSLNGTLPLTVVRIEAA